MRLGARGARRPADDLVERLMRWGASLGPTDYAPLVDTPGAENVVARYEWCRWDVNMDGTTGIEVPLGAYQGVIPFAS